MSVSAPSRSTTSALRSATWRALGVQVRLVVTDADRLGAARADLAARLEALDATCSRFRSDSELVRLDEAGGRPTRVSPLLADAVAVALNGARRTGGALDPTLGHHMSALGYDRTFSQIADTDSSASGTAAQHQLKIAVSTAASWRDVHLDRPRGMLQVPAGVRLDLGATAKAWAADRAAAALAADHGCGVLVSLGGDLAMAGPAPEGGWPIAVQQTQDDEPAQVIALTGGGLATSGTAARRWTRGGELLHHVLDPRTGMPARTPWRAVTVAAASCLEANLASTTTIVRGAAGLAWLRARDLPSRLVGEDGSVVQLGRWP
ncbi:MAG: FAD:protein FMN transferase [Kineosporiaceae bacterium]|nr:FAD:protein FMN transferase [Kineosporiaceae bacterium]MBK7625217.1 FAD:protein FMN transferase [Kineosporiaceae bacterium]MBK8076403.1 FAD:protein FMN transferase [Kineosporiaceae bacterium]